MAPTFQSLPARNLDGPFCSDFGGSAKTLQGWRGGVLVDERLLAFIGRQGDDYTPLLDWQGDKDGLLSGGCDCRYRICPLAMRPGELEPYGHDGATPRGAFLVRASSVGSSDDPTERWWLQAAFVVCIADDRRTTVIPHEATLVVADAPGQFTRFDGQLVGWLASGAVDQLRLDDTARRLAGVNWQQQDLGHANAWLAEVAARSA